VCVCVCVCVYLTSVRSTRILSRVLKAPKEQRTPGGVGRPGVFLAITRYIRFLKTKTLTGNKEETIVGFT